jgi:hypothetical protein
MPARSPQNAWTVRTLSAPSFSLATMNIADRESFAATDWLSIDFTNHSPRHLGAR